MHTAHYIQILLFKIEIKTKVDLYMPCEAMAHSTQVMLLSVITKHLHTTITTHQPGKPLIGSTQSYSATPIS